MRIFRDSVIASSIPMEGLDGALGYVNGKYRWTAADFDRFTKAGKQVARIDVTGGYWHEAAILDVEENDATPSDAAVWITERNRFRGDATIYTSLSSLGALLGTCDHLPFWLIVADWTGHPHVPDLTLPANVRLAGVQYASYETYDESCIVADDWHRRTA